MPTTKYRLAEQIMILLEGDDRKEASPVEMFDVTEAIGQVLNTLLKTSYFQNTLGNGERTPEGLVLATYEDVPVAQYRGRARAILPAVPQMLVRGIGIFQVSPQEDWSVEYLPIPPGQWWMIQKEAIISDLLGFVGYENFGLDLVFTKDITTLPTPVTHVMVRLAVVDISRMSDYDLLPIPADMESVVIKEVYNLLTSQRPEEKIDDPTAEQQKGGKQ